MRRICTIALGLGVLGLASTAKAVNVDFEGHQEGGPVEFAGFGTGIFAVSVIGNSNGNTQATVLNTEGPNAGPQTKLPYSGGNLKTSRLRKVLIAPTDAGGLDPDSAGGQLTLTFFGLVRSFGFDVVDVDAADAPNTFVTFRFQGSDLAVIPFSEFKNTASPFKRPTVVWGNNSANRIAPITSTELGFYAFDEVVFDFPSEMAFDNFNYRQTVIPEPTAAGILFGIPAIAEIRRRRSK